MELIATLRPPIFLNALLAALVTAWMWLPIVFLAYAIGRKQFSLAWMLAFLAVESLAFATFAWCADWY